MHGTQRVGHEHVKGERHAERVQAPHYGIDGTLGVAGRMLGDQGAPHDHQQRDAEGREHGSPPGQRQQEEDVPIEQRPRPAAHHSEKHVVKNVPHAERER